MTAYAAGLKEAFDYYLSHQEELVRRYNGRFIAIKNRQVLGDFASELEAVREVSKLHELGTFLVQFVEPGQEAYTQTFHSRVAFA